MSGELDPANGDAVEPSTEDSNDSTTDSGWTIEEDSDPDYGGA